MELHAAAMCVDHPAMEGDACVGEFAEWDGDDRAVVRLHPPTKGTVRGHVEQTEDLLPPEDVAPQRSLRHADVVFTTREVNLAAASGQLQGDLIAGVPSAHHQYGAAGELTWSAISTAVQLHHARSQPRAGRWDSRGLKGTGATTTCRARQAPRVLSTANPSPSCWSEVTRVSRCTGSSKWLA